MHAASLRPCVADVVQGPKRVGSATGERLAIVRPSGARPCLVDVTALDVAAGFSGAGRVLAALLVTAGACPPMLRPEPLRTFYGLTPSEADLAVRLAQGRSLDQIRSERGVTTNTARGQLKRIFLETGTHRQADLVRLVLQDQARLPVR